MRVAGYSASNDYFSSNGLLRTATMPLKPDFPRYSTLALPKRPFMPGRDPHPRDDPERAHLPEFPRDSCEFDASAWGESVQYLYAVDLFNNGFWWEAHEVIEGLWLAVGQSTPVGSFLQGLIQVSVALLKKSQESLPAARRLADRGLSRMRSSGGNGEGVSLGIEVNAFAEGIEAFLAGRQPEPPVIVLEK